MVQESGAVAGPDTLAGKLVPFAEGDLRAVIRQRLQIGRLARHLAAAGIDGVVQRIFKVKAQAHADCAGR